MDRISKILRPGYLINDKVWAAGKSNTRKKKEENQGDDSPPVKEAQVVTVSSVSTLEDRHFLIRRAEDAYRPEEESQFWGSRIYKCQIL